MELLFLLESIGVNGNTAGQHQIAWWFLMGINESWKNYSEWKGYGHSIIRLISIRLIRQRSFSLLIGIRRCCCSNQREAFLFSQSPEETT